MPTFRRIRRVITVVVLMFGYACEDAGEARPPANVAGTWALYATVRDAGVSCEVETTLRLNQSGDTLFGSGNTGQPYWAGGGNITCVRNTADGKDTTHDGIGGPIETTFKLGSVTPDGDVSFTLLEVGRGHLDCTGRVRGDSMMEGAAEWVFNWGCDIEDCNYEVRGEWTATRL